MIRYMVVGALAYVIGYALGYVKARKIYKKRGYW